jgi:hypothetical protein
MIETSRPPLCISPINLQRKFLLCIPSIMPLPFCSAWGSPSARETLPIFKIRPPVSRMRQFIRLKETFGHDDSAPAGSISAVNQLSVLSWNPWSHPCQFLAREQACPSISLHFLPIYSLSSPARGAYTIAGKSPTEFVD